MATQKSRRRPATPPPSPRAPSLAYVTLLGLKPVGTLALVETVNRGLPYSAFEHLRQATGLNARELARTVGIPPRTLHRRRAQGRLEADESDRLVRLSRVYGKALELFERDRAEAHRWFTSVQPALGGGTPLALTGTDVGAREVETLIGRLEHGIFA